MTASGLVFTVFLTLSKVQSAEYDPGFLAFFRSFIALILTLPVIIQQGWGIMRIHQHPSGASQPSPSAAPPPTP